MLSLNIASSRIFLALIKNLMPDGSATVRVKKLDTLHITRLHTYQSEPIGDIEVFRLALVPKNSAVPKVSFRFFFMDSRKDGLPENVTIIPHAVFFEGQQDSMLVSYIENGEIVFAGFREDDLEKLNNWFVELEHLGYTR